MPITGQFTQEHKQQQVALLRKGIKLNGSELRIYTDILNEPCTAVELAIKYSVSKQAIYNITRVLQKLNLIRKMGDSAYWEVITDLRETTDLYLRWIYKKEPLILAQLAWYLNDPKDLKYVATITRMALAHLYSRAKKVSEGDKPLPPSGPEVRSMLTQVAKSLLEFHELIQQIIKTEQLFDKQDNELYESFGSEYSEKTKDYLEFASQSFRQMWGNTISGRGYKGSAEFLSPLNILTENFEGWEHPYNPDKAYEDE